MLLVATFPSIAQEDGQEWPETIVVIGDPSTIDHEGSYEEVECEEQFALVVTDVPGCGDMGGEHVRTGYRLWYGWRTTGAGDHGAVPLTGWLQARISWMDGEHEIERTHTCLWDDGEYVECRIQKLWGGPPLGTPFRFECYSLEGAIGGWAECFMGHD